MTDFERRVEFGKAWDQRDPDPSKDFGIGGVRIWFTLIGPTGAVKWELMTSMFLTETHERLEREVKPRFFRPTAGPVGWHSLAEREGWEYQVELCQYVSSGHCWFAWSYTAGEPLLDMLLQQGDAGLWAAMETLYHEQFGEEAGDD